MIFGLKKKPHMVLKAGQDDYSQIGELHGRSFARGWSVSEIEDLSSQDSVFTFVARQVGKPKAAISGFNMVRFTGEEAEILSIAVASSMRRRGIGELMMREAIRFLQTERASMLFLEVDSTNAAAVKLYERLGFEIIGNRPGYYKCESQDAGAEAIRATALVMRLNLS